MGDHLDLPNCMRYWKNDKAEQQFIEDRCEKEKQNDSKKKWKQPAKLVKYVKYPTQQNIS